MVFGMDGRRYENDEVGATECVEIDQDVGDSFVDE